MTAVVPTHEEGPGARSECKLTWHVYQISVKQVKRQSMEESTDCTPKMTYEECA